MAAVLDLLLAGNVPVSGVLDWLMQQKQLDLVELQDLNNLRAEFIPFFLNYLRDQTLHLLQNNRSVTPSPSKTPICQKFEKQQHNSSSESTPRPRGQRVQLFSPVERHGSISDIGSPSLLSDTSFDSPVKNHVIRDKGSAKSYRQAHAVTSASDSQTGSRQQSSRQRMNLGDFLTSTDAVPHSRKKKSPAATGMTGGRRDLSFMISDDTRSPSPGSVRRANKKRSQLCMKSPITVYPGTTSATKAPILSLSNMDEFPPIGQSSKSQEKVQPSRRIKPTLISLADKGSGDVKPMSINSVFQTAEIQPQAQTKRRISLGSSENSNDRVNHCSSMAGGDRLAEDKVIMRNEKTDLLESRFGLRDFLPISSSSSFQTINCDLPSLLSVGANVPVEVTCASTACHSVAINSTHESSPAKSLFKTPTKCTAESKLSTVTPTKLLLERLSSVTEIVAVERSEVTHEDQLETVASLYSGCLDACLFPNITVELYYIVQLLTIKNADPDTAVFEAAGETCLFCSIHNAVYFATRVLEKQHSLVLLLDKSTLRLLSENQRVIECSPSLRQLLLDALERQTASSLPNFLPSPIGGVSFQADTDNRKNFPTDRSFHLFKKQRDCFYELLREWESNHNTTGWSMFDKLGARIQNLVSSKTELANHLHLARLFQSQLISMCKGDQSYKMEGDDEQVALLTQLKQSNPQKFKRLQQRFIMPMNLGGPCPAPSFPGCQEFFRGFILAASSVVFNQHLFDTFVAKVSELNTQQLVSADIETETDARHGAPQSQTVDEEQREMFVSALLTLRLLGKFTGFVLFLPYQTSERLPDSVTSSCLEVRSKMGQPCMLRECVQVACRSGRLTLTIPWVVETLSMMDQVAPLIDYFHDLLILLIKIYRYASVQMKRVDASQKYGYLLIITIIGWLFELPVIPEGFFFQALSNLDIWSSLPFDPGPDSLDAVSLVDQQLVYICCPYVGEIRSVLLDFAVGSNNKFSSVRKITPISADETPAHVFSERQLQFHLEENFFHNHTASLKRVIEFVAERTASNFIKLFRSTTLQTHLKTGKSEVVKLVGSLEGMSPNSKTKDWLNKEVHKISQNMCDSARTEASNNTARFCQVKIDSALPLLLPVDQNEAVIAMSTQISCRQAEERVTQWMAKHITSRIFHQELDQDLEKLCRPVNLQKTTSNQTPAVDNAPTIWSADKHANDMIGPTDLLTQVKILVRDVLLCKIKPAPELVLPVLDLVSKAVHNRQDVLCEGYKLLSLLMLDLVLLTVCWHPALWLPELCDRCKLLWKIPLREHASFASIISRRLLVWIHTAPQPKVSWQYLSELIIWLLDNELLSVASLGKHSLPVLKASHYQTDNVELLYCMVNVLSVHSAAHTEHDNTEDRHITELIDWLYVVTEPHAELRRKLEELHVDKEKHST